MSSEAIPVVARPDVLPSRRVENGDEPSRQSSDVDTPTGAYDAYFEVAWRNLRRLGVTELWIEDAVQDVFLVVHRRWQAFRHQSSIRTWVIGICLHVAKEYRRKRLRAEQTQEVSEDVPSPSDGPLSTVERLHATRILMTMLDGLDENQRNVFVLVELEELSVAEAAEAIGIPASTAYKRLSAARQRFEQALLRQKARDRRRAE